jgi:biopolymer transport protein ExbB
MKSLFTDLLPLASLSESWANVARFCASGGLFMGCLLLSSIVALAAIIYKAMHLRRETHLPPETVKLLSHLYAGDPVSQAEIRGLLKTDDSALGRTARVALVDAHSSREEALLSAGAVAREQVVHLERGLGLLESLITAGPLFGLLGTISGLVSVFSNLANGDGSAADPSKIAPGIAEALNTTIGGLVIAIPCVFAHSYFSRRVQEMAARLEVLVSQALSAVWTPSQPQ